MALAKYSSVKGHIAPDGDYDRVDQVREFSAIVHKLDALRCSLFKLNEMASGIAGRVFGSESESSRPDNSHDRRDGALGAVDVCLHECEAAVRDISEQLSRLDRL